MAQSFVSRMRFILCSNSCKLVKLHERHLCIASDCSDRAVIQPFNYFPTYKRHLDSRTKNNSTNRRQRNFRRQQVWWTKAHGVAHALSLSPANTLAFWGWRGGHGRSLQNIKNVRKTCPSMHVYILLAFAKHLAGRYKCPIQILQSIVQSPHLNKKSEHYTSLIHVYRNSRSMQFSLMTNSCII